MGLNACVRRLSRNPSINITDIPSDVTTHDRRGLYPIGHASGNRLSAERRASANGKRRKAGLLLSVCRFCVQRVWLSFE